ncbi:MAG: hypothetical protein HY722_04405 [Planctomycetes bacterium]|nr:hypothetical protein [Planctomycetota bacterium]
MNGAPLTLALVLALAPAAAAPVGAETAALSFRPVGSGPGGLQVRVSGPAGTRLQMRLRRGDAAAPWTPVALPPGDEVATLAPLPVPEGVLPLTLEARGVGGEPLLEAGMDLDRGWIACGPFPAEGAGYGQALGPESGPLDPWARYPAGGGEVGWRPFDAAVLEGDGYADLDALLGPADHAVAYVATVWRCEGETPAVLRLGSDDALEVFHDGARVHGADVRRPSAPAQDRVALALHPGRNLIIVKVGDEVGGWGFHLRAEAPGGGPLRGFAPEPFGLAAWTPGGPPRVTSVAADEAVLEFGSGEPALAAAEAIPCRAGPPDPRRFGAEGAAMLLDPEAGRLRFEGDAVLRTRHRVRLADLAPATRYAVRGLACGVEAGPWRTLRTPPPAGLVPVLHLRVACVFFADVVEEGPGAGRPTPRDAIRAEVDEAWRDLAETVRFFYVHSGARLALDLARFEDWRRHEVPPGTDYGYAWSGHEWEAVSRVLEDEGRTPADFDAYLLVSCDRRREGDRWVFPASGGGTYGPLPPFHAGKSAWKVGCPNDAWMFCHEFHHALDALFEASGRPDYLFNHFYAWDGTAHVHGEHWDGNGWILRSWGGHARAEAPGWFPGDASWRWSLLAWGAFRDHADADGDGLPDAAPELPLDEERLGSSPEHADTDGDGVPDLEELMRGEWLVYGLDAIRCGGAPRPMDPADPDTDGDGVGDGEDPYPLYAIPADLAGPAEFALDDPAAGRVGLRVAWEEDALRIHVATPEGVPGRVRVQLDLASDGWYVGGDNLQVEWEGGGPPRAHVVRCETPGRWAFEDPEAVPEGMLQVREGTLTVRPAPSLGFQARPGDEVGVLVCIDPGPPSPPGRGPQPHGDGRTGMLSFFEPHAFLRLRLPP